MVARLQLGHERCVDRGHACCGRHRARHPLNCGDAFFEHPDCRIGEPRIDEALVVAFEAGLGLLGGVVHIARRQVEGFAGLAEIRSRLTAPDGEGLPAPTAAVFLFSHVGHVSSPNKKPGQEPGCCPDLLSCLFNVAASRSAQITTGFFYAANFAPSSARRGRS